MGQLHFAVYTGSHAHLIHESRVTYRTPMERNAKVRPIEVRGDIGFGKAGARGRSRRLLNRDGSFNAEKIGISPFRSMGVYQILLTSSWPMFIAGTLLAYTCTNFIFAAAYLLCGHGALAGGNPNGAWEHFQQAYFFSVQTLATIGYGGIVPVGFMPNLLVSIEAMVGLLEFALITGFFFARFSRPLAHVRFSDQALIAPYGNGMSLQFRLMNERTSQLIEPEVKVVFSRIRNVDGKEVRDYQALPLLLRHILFMPLYWTVTHVINEDSPLWGITPEDLVASEAECMVLFRAVDDAFSQTVHTRTSYRGSEIVFGAKFVDLYTEAREEHVVAIDATKLSTYQKI